ncbi:hypothetical protein F5887DRAFT_536248 [Amanita rubescens]|nr:hypothetical protein F5887DRAFT_536248 [Amanita rubescens]
MRHIVTPAGPALYFRCSPASSPPVNPFQIIQNALQIFHIDCQEPSDLDPTYFRSRSWWIDLLTSKFVTALTFPLFMRRRSSHWYRGAGECGIYVQNNFSDARKQCTTRLPCLCGMVLCYS